jgi:UDP-N-acetylmuramate dehydrogenase
VAALERATGEQVRLSGADCRFGYRDSVFKRHPERYLITAIELQLDLEPAPVLTYQPLVAALERSGVADPGPRDVFRAVCDLRRARLPDPSATPNAGSFFVNPTVAADRWERLQRRHPRLVAFEQPGGGFKLAAGWLVERCGFKGHRQGAVGVSLDQALVLINHGGATGAELLALAERIRTAVRETFGVELAIEPRVI